MSEDFQVFDDFEDIPEEVEPELVEVKKTVAFRGAYVYKGVTYPPRAVVTVPADLADELTALQRKGRPLFVRTS